MQLAEPILFGRMINALAHGRCAFGLIGLWAGLGLLGILTGALVAIAADRLAHRRRLAAMAAAFERAITLPIGYHAAKGSGAVVRSILAGTDALAAFWLAFLREHLTVAPSTFLSLVMRSRRASAIRPDFANKISNLSDREVLEDCLIYLWLYLAKALHEPLASVHLQDCGDGNP